MKHTSTIKKPQLWPHNHLDSHFVSNMPKFQDISWDQLVAGEVAIILPHSGHGQALPVKTVGILETSLRKFIQSVTVIYGCGKRILFVQ